jgi:tetratricopeptide (TPR) repeat protein
MKEKTITIYSKDGQRLFMSLSEWRTGLPKMFENANDNPDELNKLIVMSLRDGLEKDCMDAARRLRDIDTDKERSANLLGIVLMRNGLLDEAEQVLEDYLKYNASGPILTNLAKVFMGKGEEEKGMETLWKALKTDPNQENALGWWYEIHSEKGEIGKAYQSFEELCQIKGSWRPQGWLADKFLEEQDLKGALAQYRAVLKVAGNKGDALLMVSGGLTSKGHPKEALSMVLPLYKPVKHGPFTGINLINACIQLNDKETGLKLCDEMENLGRFDLKERLDSLREKLNKL